MSELENRPWTNEDFARLYQGRLNFIPYAVLADQLGRTANACEHQWRVRDTWIKRLRLDPDDHRQEAKQVEVEKLVTRLDTRSETNRIRADVLADRIAESIKALPKAPPAFYKPSRKTASRSSEDAGLILSDLHIGQKYTLEETGGLSEYSIQKFIERLDNLKKGIKEITELHASLYKMPTLNIFMLGDNTHGMSGVGQWSAAYIEESIVDQVMLGVKHLSDFIFYMLGMYQEVHIYAVGGNHGRAAEKGAEKDYVNWDFITYKMLELYFKDNPRVKIYAPKTWHIFTTIRNHRFLMVHGEDVKGGNFPIQSLLKVEQKYIGMIGEVPHYTLAGHFHSAAEISTNHGRVYINGAFTGPDPHSLKAIQAGGRAEQLFFGIHDKRGVTWKYNIDLDFARN